MSAQRAPTLIALCAECGLANRLKVMANVHALATLLRVPFEVDWRPAPGCVVEYDALFDRRPRFAELTDTRWNPGLRVRDRVWEPPQRRVWQGPRVHVAKLGSALPALADDGFDAALINSAGMSDLRLDELPPNLLRTLKSRFYKTLPVHPELKARAERVRKNWPEKSRGRLVGVHVRQFSALHDAADGIEFDSLSPFEDFVETLRGHARAVRFAVFSNAPELAARLVETVGRDCAFVAREPGLRVGRDDQEGVRDALVDMLLLGSCGLLIGSYFSSFSDEAALFGGVAAKFCPLSPHGVERARTNPYHAVGFELDEAARQLRSAEL